MKRMCSHFLTEKVKNQNKFDELPYFLPFRKAIAFGSATSSCSVEWSHSIVSTFPKETNFFKNIYNQNNNTQYLSYKKKATNLLVIFSLELELS